MQIIWLNVHDVFGSCDLVACIWKRMISDIESMALKMATITKEKRMITKNLLAAEKHGVIQKFSNNDVIDFSFNDIEANPVIGKYKLNLINVNVLDALNQEEAKVLQALRELNSSLAQIKQVKSRIL